MTQLKNISGAKEQHKLPWASIWQSSILDWLLMDISSSFSCFSVLSDAGKMLMEGGTLWLLPAARVCRIRILPQRRALPRTVCEVNL